jgi:hypothetical protein
MVLKLACRGGRPRLALVGRRGCRRPPPRRSAELGSVVGAPAGWRGCRQCVADLAGGGGGAERAMTTETSAGAGFAGATDEELVLIEALRDGDRAAFALLIDRYGQAMLRVAGMYVATAEAAEVVVQET